MKKIKSSELKGKRLAIGQMTYTSIKTYHMLKRDGVSTAMFFDRDFRTQHQKYDNTPIFPWANFYDAYVILTISSRYDELIDFLKNSCGYTDDRIIRLEEIEFECKEGDICGDFDWSWIADNTGYASDSYILNRRTYFEHSYPKSNNLFTPMLSVDVTNKCTLNCEYCYTQMPYYRDEDKKHYDMDQVVSNLEKVLNAVDYIPYLWILGGEPLLHPELYKLIQYINSAKAQEKIVFADILTNATLTMSPDVVEALKENPLFWRISASPYGTHSKKQYELFSQLSENGIPYYSRYMMYWQKFGLITEPVSTDEEYIKTKCEHCVCKNMHLTNGNIYRCPVVAHYSILKRVPFDERNFFDCSKDFSKEELKSFYDGYSPAMAYCNGNHEIRLGSMEEKDQYGGDFVPVAGQAKGMLAYKRYD